MCVKVYPFYIKHRCAQMFLHRCDKWPFVNAVLQRHIEFVSPVACLCIRFLSENCNEVVL